MIIWNMKRVISEWNRPNEHEQKQNIRDAWHIVGIYECADEEMKNQLNWENWIFRCFFLFRVLGVFEIG